MFHKKSDHLRRLLLVLELAVLALVFVTVLNVYRAYFPAKEISALSHYFLLVLILAVFAFARDVLVKDSVFSQPSFTAQIWCIAKEILLTLVVVTGFIFSLKLEFASRGVLFGFAAAGMIALLALRMFLIWWYFFNRRETREKYLNVLIIGSGIRARALADRLERVFEWGVNIVGFLDPRGESAGRRADDTILGHVNDIDKVLRDSVVEEVIVAVPRSMLADVQSIVDACEREGVQLRFMVDIYDFDAARVRLSMIEEIPLLSFEPVARAENALIAKRIFDLIVTIIAMPVVLPILACVAVAIRLDSPGPAIFTQNRVGLHKRKFKLFKFRSMVIDAEAKLKEIEHLNEADGPNFKIADDPRVTRVGRFIRKTSIDELPQLFNVLLGDMSLVGPRPMSSRDVDLFDKGVQRKRFSVMPGITCLWQVSGRSDLSFDDWLKLDLEYIRKWSFWLDVKILFQTVPAVLKGSGAV